MLRRVLSAVTRKFKNFTMAETSTQLMANEVTVVVMNVIDPLLVFLVVICGGD